MYFNSFKELQRLRRGPYPPLTLHVGHSHSSPQKQLRRGKASPKTSKAISPNTPPQIRSNVTLSHRYRFSSTSATATQISPLSILCAAGTMCTVANTTVTTFFSAAKINLIEIWSPPASQGTNTTCAVDWAGATNNTPNIEVSDTSVSVSTPAHVSTGPPRQSLASFWFTYLNSSTGLCTITAPVGSIIDIHLSLVLVDDEAALPAVTQAVATGTLGIVYYLSLDLNATHRFVPISLTTTT